MVSHCIARLQGEKTVLDDENEDPFEVREDDNYGRETPLPGALSL